MVGNFPDRSAIALCTGLDDPAPGCPERSLACVLDFHRTAAGLQRSHRQPGTGAGNLAEPARACRGPLCGRLRASFDRVAGPDFSGGDEWRLERYPHRAADHGDPAVWGLVWNVPGFSRSDQHAGLGNRHMGRVLSVDLDPRRPGGGRIYALTVATFDRCLGRMPDLMIEWGAAGSFAEESRAPSPRSVMISPSLRRAARRLPEERESAASRRSLARAVQSIDHA